MEEFSLLKPTTDFIFKRIFGNEEGKVALISLLNAILNGNPIVKDIKFLNTEVPKDEIYSKASRLDVEVTTDNGTIVNVEIQCVDTGDLDDRAITYESQLIGQYTRQGTNYKEPKVISIWIIRDPIQHGPMSERNCPIEKASVYLEENTWCKQSKRLSTKFRIIFVQLSRFKDEKLLNTLSKLMRDWAKFFEDPSKVDNKDGGMKEAQCIWTKVSGDKAVKAQIKAIEKYEMDKKSEMTNARNEGKEEGLIEGKKEGLIEGKKEGLIEGKKEGLIEGKKEGLIEGKKEGLIEGEKKKMKELALNMKNQGFENEVIAKCLNISIDELNKLMFPKN